MPVHTDRRGGPVFVVLLLALLSSDCATKVYTDPHAFLQSMINQASQDDVAKRLGPSTTSRTLADGGEVWAYDYRSDPVSRSQDNNSGSVCRRLILVFDKGKILRDWRREPC